MTNMLQTFSLNAAGKGGLSMRARMQACKRLDEAREKMLQQRERITFHRGLLADLKRERRKAMAVLKKEQDNLQDAFDLCLSSSLLLVRYAAASEVVKRKPRFLREKTGDSP